MMREDPVIAQLPALLASYARETSLRAALELAAAFGGRRVYVPRRPGRGSELVRRIGPNGAAALLKLSGPGQVLIPLGPIGTVSRQREQIARLLDSGAAVPEIVDQLRCHERTVYRHKRRRRRANDGRQRELFP